MDIAKNWQDYTLLDAGDGEKLERWGDVTVIRPDPLACWPRSKNANWAVADMHYHRSKSGGGHWEKLTKNAKDTWQIAYNGLNFHIRPTGFKHMGLFPEQAVNWTWLRDKIEKANNASAERFNVLNLFAYTGGATVACLKAGASVTHIDAAKGMNRWAKDNIALSGLSHMPCRIMEDDALKFVQREGRRKSYYDGIIMDPPVFGRGPGGEMWKLEEKLYELVEACIQILNPAAKGHGAKFLLINTYTAGFSATVYGNILSIVAKKYKLGGNVSVGEIGLNAISGVTLPCGTYARWDAGVGTGLCRQSDSKSR